MVMVMACTIIVPLLTAQTPYVKQVITGNSGKFEFAPPYQDYVTLQSYEPVSGQSTLFHTIFTQSVQDILIHERVAYVAAQDSIVKIDLTTLQRVAAIADSGVSKLLLVDDKLVVSKQFPVSVYFAEVLNAGDLSPVTSVSGIAGDCGYMVAVDDSVYIAVNGGWMGTEGKIAVVDGSSWNLVRHINLGAQAVGIMNLYRYGNSLISINKSPFATPNTGSISAYNLTTHAFANSILNKNVSLGAGVAGNLLYFGYNYGIGSFNLNTMQIEDSVIVADPGSLFFRYITSATIDTLNERLYVNTGDYVTEGTCLVTNLTGDSLTSYPTGISTDAVAVDYRVSGTSMAELNEPISLQVSPNPATDFTVVTARSGAGVPSFCISDLSGRVVYRYVDSGVAQRSVRIDAGSLTRGMYILTFDHTGERGALRFIRK